MSRSVNDVMPGRDGPENLKILKKSQLGVDFEPCRQTVGFSAIEADSRSWGFEIRPCRQTIEFLPLGQRIETSIVAAVVKFFGSRPAKMNWDLKHYEMCRTGVVSIVWLRKTFKNCVFLLVSKNWSQVINKTFVPEATESACVFAYVYVLLLLI